MNAQWFTLLSWLGLVVLCGCGVALVGWIAGRRRPRTDRNDKPDCEGTSPCSTCQDVRECGRAGCVRQHECAASGVQGGSDA